MKKMSLKQLSLWSIIPLCFLIFHYPTNQQAHRTVAEVWGRKVLGGLPPESVILAYGDIESFILGALIVLEKVRPDLSISSFDQIFGPLPGRPSRGLPGEVISKVLEALGDRPIYHMGLPGSPSSDSWEVVSDGFLYAIQKKGTTPVPDRTPEAIVFFEQEMIPKKSPTLPWEQDLIQQAATFLIPNLLKEGKIEKAKEYASYSPFGWYLISETYGRMGMTHHPQALEALRQSLLVAQARGLRPPYQTYLKLAMSYLESGRHKPARKMAKKSITFFPWNPLGHLLLAKVALAEGDYSSALSSLRTSLALDPGLKEASRLLASLESRLREKFPLDGIEPKTQENGLKEGQCGE